MRSPQAFLGSLSFRLTLFSAVFVGVALLLLGMLTRALISDAIETQWQTELRNRLDGLVAYQDVLPITSIDPGLYGELYSGNYWEVLPAADSLPQASISLADYSLAGQLPSHAENGSFHRLSGPIGEPLLAVIDAALPTEDGLQKIIVARDATELDRFRAQLLQKLNAIQLLTWLVAVTATALSTRMGGRPVRQLARELTALGAGRRPRVSESVPTELVPLARTLNRVMQINEARLRRQRETAANLAHELKTPLTALQQQAELRTTLEAAFVRDKVQRMWEPLEQELARARVHGPTPGLEPTVVATEVDRAIRLCCSDHAVSADDFSIVLAKDLTLSIETRDLFTVIWNLLDNAVRHGGPPVSIRADARSIRIEDSGGPGSAAQRPDSGAGLRLVTHILETYGCSLTVTASEHGGRCCIVSLPAAADLTLASAAERKR